MSAIAAPPETITQWFKDAIRAHPEESEKLQAQLDYIIDPSVRAELETINAHR